MKTFCSIFLFFAASTNAFVPTKLGLSPTVLKASQTANEAIEIALEASKTHGPTSKEARVAWDIVEEINASDNSVATKGQVTVDANSPEALEYAEKVQELTKILDEQKAQIESVKDLASKIRSIKLVQPESRPQSVSDAMVTALEEAKDMSEKFGASSTEAKLAWETVEDIASNSSSEATKAGLDDECLIETIEACEAIEEMQRALHVNENAGSGSFSG